MVTISAILFLLGGILFQTNQYGCIFCKVILYCYLKKHQSNLIVLEGQECTCHVRLSKLNVFCVILMVSTYIVSWKYMLFHTRNRWYLFLEGLGKTDKHPHMKTNKHEDN